MIGTTPTHTFTVPFDTEIIKSIEITYVQCDKIVLIKGTADCIIIDGHTIKTTLTQEETFLFDESSVIEIQLRVGVPSPDSDGKAKIIKSNIVKVMATECLSDEVLS